MIFDNDRQKDDVGENNWKKDNEKGYTPEEAIRILGEAQILENLRKAVKKYGLEGTEDVIKGVYKNSPTLRDKFLKILYEIWKR